MKALPLSAALLGLVLLACGGNDGAKTGTARELRDPRTVPSATVAQLATPLTAIDISAPRGRPTPPPDVYVVKAGDTPAGIAQELGVELAELLRVNSIDDPRSLRVGQQLKVPRPPTPAPTPGRAGTAGATPARTATGAAASPTRAGQGTPAASGTAARTPTPTSTAGSATTYTVQAGDTACGIAAKLGVPLTALAEANRTTVAGLANLSIGQVLNVPATRGPAGC